MFSWPVLRALEEKGNAVLRRFMYVALSPSRLFETNDFYILLSSMKTRALFSRSFLYNMPPTSQVYTRYCWEIYVILPSFPLDQGMHGTWDVYGNV
jgi:hypothetical protein